MDTTNEEPNPDVVRSHLYSTYSLNRAKDHLGGWDYAVVGIYFLVIIITGIYVSRFLYPPSVLFPTFSMASQFSIRFAC